MAKLDTLTKPEIPMLRIAPAGFDYGRYLPPLRMTQAVERHQERKNAPFRYHYNKN